jgi:hypothetical protein
MYQNGIASSIVHPSCTGEESRERAKFNSGLKPPGGAFQNGGKKTFLLSNHVAATLLTIGTAQYVPSSDLPAFFPPESVG